MKSVDKLRYNLGFVAPELLEERISEYVEAGRCNAKEGALLLEECRENLRLEQERRSREDL